jgi:hypothetical protein
MDMIRWNLVIPFAAILLFTASAVAKRNPPKPVPPVISGGIRYSAEGDARDQYVVATDMASGNQLWKVKVFHNRIKPWMEVDVQWVVITDLKLVDNALLVKDERSRSIPLTLRGSA